MFNGPSLESMTPGASFGRFNAYRPLEGNGGPVGGWGIAKTLGNTQENWYITPVGLGNTVIVLADLNLLPQQNNTDIKYIDVRLFYTFYAPPTDGTYPFRFPENSDISIIRTHLFCNTDSESKNDPLDPGAIAVSRKFRYYRLISPRDPDSGGIALNPWGVLYSNPTIVETAVADYMLLAYRFVAVDPAETCIMREGELVQFASVAGGVGRSY